MFGNSTFLSSISLSLQPFRRTKKTAPKTSKPAASTARDRAMTRSITRTWPRRAKAATARHSTPPPSILEVAASPETPTPLQPIDSSAEEHESHENSRQGAQEDDIKASAPKDYFDSLLEDPEAPSLSAAPINRVTNTPCVSTDVTTTSHQAPGNTPADSSLRGPSSSDSSDNLNNGPPSTAGPSIKRSKAFQTMLCDAAPVILISDDHAEECRRQDLVRALALTHNPWNVVDPSPDPARVPHIAITPPPFQYESVDEVIANNKIPVQKARGRRQLTTPILNEAVCRLHRHSELPQLLHQQWYERRIKFFRHEWFKYLVERRKTERSAPATSAVVSSLYRKLFLCSAITASLYSQSFRAHWDNPAYAQSVDKPFKWSDPVMEFAAFRRRVLRPKAPEGVIVSVLPRSLDLHPFTACHLPPSTTPEIVFVIESVPMDDLSKEGIERRPNFVPEQNKAYLTVNRRECKTDKDSFMGDFDSDSESEGPSTPLQRVTTTYFEDIMQSHGGEDDSEVQTGFHDYTPFIEARRVAQEGQPPEANFVNNISPSKFFLSTIDENDDDEEEEEDCDGNEYSYGYDDDDEEDSLPDMDTDPWFIQHRRLMEERQAGDSLS